MTDETGEVVEATENTTVQDGGEATETNTNVTEAPQGEEQIVTNQLDYSLVKLPDGVAASEKEMGEFAGIVDKIGIKNQESLQNFVDWIFEVNAAEESRLAQKEEQATKEWETIKSGWKETLTGDADFGKEYDLNVKRANDVMFKYGGSELTSWLKDSDLGGHPALLKTFARIGKELEDGRLLSGGSGIETSKVKRDRYNQPMLTYKD